MSGKSGRRLRRHGRRRGGNPPTSNPQAFDPSTLTEEQKAQARQKLRAEHRGQQVGKGRELLALTRAAAEESAKRHQRLIKERGEEDEAVKDEAERLAGLEEFEYDVQDYFISATEFLLADVEVEEATEDPNFPEWLEEEKLIEAPDAVEVAISEASKDRTDLPAS